MTAAVGFATVLGVEARKLRHSLALLLAVAAPGLIAGFTFFNVLQMKEPRIWAVWMANMTGLWGVFMLPLAITALTALMAQTEHGAHSWDHLRALPVPRWTLYAAKLACTVALIAAMTVLLLVMTVVAVELAALVNPAIAPTDRPALAAVATPLLRMDGSALLMTAIQLWLAIRFTSFVPALSVGIAGTFFALVANAAWQGVFLPWQMPINMMAKASWRGDLALALGLGGGVIFGVLLLVHLAQREVLS